MKKSFRVVIIHPILFSYAYLVGTKKNNNGVRWNGYSLMQEIHVTDTVKRKIKRKVLLKDT